MRVAGLDRDAALAEDLGLAEVTDEDRACGDRGRDDDVEVPEGFDTDLGAVADDGERPPATYRSLPSLASRKFSEPQSEGLITIAFGSWKPPRIAVTIA